MFIQTTNGFNGRPSVAALICAAVLAACGGGGGDDAPGTGTLAPQAPPPWGSLTLTGAGAVPQALSKFTPNRVPFLTQDDGSTVHAVLWNYDNLHDPRAAVAEPAVNNSGDLLIVTDIVNPSGPFIGRLAIGFFLNAPDAASPNHSALVSCGGGTGVFATYARDAVCERITWNAATRSVRFDSIALPSLNATLNGELSYPAFNVNASTTGRASSWGACPALTTGIAALRWSDAQCLNGSYVGVSDGNQPCSLTVDANAQTARVEIDGYSQTYRFALGYEATSRAVEGTPEKIWEFYFGTTATLPTGQEADALLVSVGDVPGLRMSDASLGHALAFAVQHTTAPAGVAGPVDTKWCIAPVAN